MEGINVLFVDVCDNRLDAELADDLLVDKAFPQCQLILLNLEEVSVLCVCCDLWVYEFGLVDATAAKLVVVCDNPHLVLAEYEQEIPMVPPPMLWKGRSSQNM